jgi:hypothetical protein
MPHRCNGAVKPKPTVKSYDKSDNCLSTTCHLPIPEHATVSFMSFSYARVVFPTIMIPCHLCDVLMRLEGISYHLYRVARGTMTPLYMLYQRPCALLAWSAGSVGAGGFYFSVGGVTDGSNGAT